MKLLLRFFGWIFAVGTVLFLVGVAGAAGLFWHFSKDLPDYSQLQDYEPPVMTRVHAADGSLVAEYARERRLYLPIQAIPKLVINAFIAAEDKNFYEHGGLDFQGIVRAGRVHGAELRHRTAAAGRLDHHAAGRQELPAHQRGDASSARSRKRCSRCKIERTYSKDKILELYLNEIYLGLGAYGVAAASLLYFDKSVHELTPAEAAYLAALPKAPNNYHPFRQRERAIERRNYVLDRMVEDGYLKPRGRREGEEGAARRHAAHDRRAHLRGGIFRRGSAPRAQRPLRREEALRRRAVGAHHARSQAAGDRAQDLIDGLVKLRRERTAIAARSRRSTFRATGASSSPR